MSATSRVIAAGTRVFAQGGSESSYTQLAGLVSVGGPNATADTIDTTELDPYEGGTTPAAPEFFKIAMAGWRDGGEASMVWNFTQANLVRVQSWFDQGLTAGFYIELRNGVKRSFSAFITALGQAQEKEGLVTLSVSLKITGKIGLTTGP